VVEEPGVGAREHLPGRLGAGRGQCEHQPAEARHAREAHVRVWAKARQAHGRDAHRRERAHALGRVKREPQAPLAAARAADDRHSVEPKGVEQRAQQRDAVTAQVGAAVVEAGAQAEAGAVEHDRATSGQCGKQRRPGRRDRAIARHK